MMLKFQAPVPGQQPNAVAGATATMALPIGNRIGVVYLQLTVIKAAGGGGVYSLPLITDIASPTAPLYVKINGNIQINRLVSELLAMNALQSDRALGSVQYFQAGALVATVDNALNATNPAGLAANTATTAIFQVPIYFIEYWRKNLRVAESLAWPTLFSDGSTLPQITVECPIANNGGGAFSGWNIQIWWDYDNMVMPASVSRTNSKGVTTKTSFTANGVGKPFIVKKGRYTEPYGATGNLNITPIVQKDKLMQFSLLVATGDFISQVMVKKNGTIIRNITKAQNDQSIFDHEMNVGGVVQNRFDIVFDINDDPKTSLPLAQSDTFEIIATLQTVQAAAQCIILTESFGQPD